jgi:hypothetical protein
MATLEEEISALKAKIEGYEQEYANAASGSEEKKMYANLITARGNNLTVLLQQQQQQHQQAQAGGGGQGQFTPRLMKSVFVLIDDNLSPAGTAFIISRTCVISAYHCVAENAENPTRKHIEFWRIANGLERKSDGNVSVLSPQSVIPLQVIKYAVRDDWVLLRRTDGFEFDEDLVIPVCPRDSVPNHDDEVWVKIYHCPIDLFRDGMVDVVRPCSCDYRLGMISNHRAFVQTGLFGGSSGGLYALMNGKALAMHVESVNTSQSISNISKSNKTFDEKECASQASDSCANTYASFASGIILSTYSQLMKQLS